MENIEQNIALVSDPEGSSPNQRFSRTGGPTQRVEPERTEAEAEDISGEVASLRGEMHAKISEALSLGVFTDKEARDWEAGFDACTEVEHMYNLIEIIDDFISSGLDIVEAISNTLNTDLLTNREKATWEMMADRLSYQEKYRLLAELAAILKDVAKNKQQLFKLMQSNKLSLTKAKELINTFAGVEADDKIKVVDRAKLEIAGEAKRRQMIKSEVLGLVAQKQYAQARLHLSDRASFLESDDYSAIMGLVDQAEISHTQTIMRTA
ncbi:hypothetical protein KJ836_00420 [Patescibacteria group bacterium]|nr:hypothetical protein [Patescibacteria group bacterium]